MFRPPDSGLWLFWIQASCLKGNMSNEIRKPLRHTKKDPFIMSRFPMIHDWLASDCVFWLCGHLFVLADINVSFSLLNLGLWMRTERYYLQLSINLDFISCFRFLRQKLHKVPLNDFEIVMYFSVVTHKLMKQRCPSLIECQQGMLMTVQK